jgi:two-component system, response regulator PdtaR
MTQALRIAVADDEPRMLEFFGMVLEQLGHELIVKAANGKELVDHCRDLRPDLIITDIRMPDMDGLEAVKQIAVDQVIPVILVSGYHDPQSIEAAMRENVLAYLVKPIKKDDLQPAIGLVMRRFKELQALQQQTQDLRQALDSRKWIERAKGILMRRAGFTEDEAFRRLQSLSRQKNLKMAELAEMIVTAEDAMS